MKVIYPVLFYEEKEGGYSAFVPDLENELNINASTFGENLIAGIVLDEMEEENKIPKASKIQDINIEEFEKKLDIENWDYISKFKTYIAVDISEFTKKWGKELVKKTVNIPKWINTKAEELKINFSKTLEEALLKEIYK